MQRGLVAGGIVVGVVAVAIAAFVLTGGEEEHVTERTGVGEPSADTAATESGARETMARIEEPITAQSQPAPTGLVEEQPDSPDQVVIRQVPRETAEGETAETLAEAPAVAESATANDPESELEPEPESMAGTPAVTEPQAETGVEAATLAESTQLAESLPETLAEAPTAAEGLPLPKAKPETVVEAPTVAESVPSSEAEPEPETALQARSEAVESEGLETQTAALPPDSTPAPMAPVFDIVRVEPNGDTVVAGRAEPGFIVILFDGDQEIARVVADVVGAWVIILEYPLSPGDHQLGLRAEGPNGVVVLSDSLVIVSIPEPPVAVAAGESDPEEQVATVLGEQVPLAVETPRGDLGATRVLQQPIDAGLRDRALLLNAVDYDADGFVIISGQARPGVRVIVYLDDKPIGTALAGEDGRWQLAPAEAVAPGLHRLRVDQVDDSGDVLARVATLFSRAELAGGFPEDRYVIVQPGNSLWRIARRTYGQGFRYSVIFQANGNQITDPNMIFPGQIFLVPGTE